MNLKIIEHLKILFAPIITFFGPVFKNPIFIKFFVLLRRIFKLFITLILGFNVLIELLHFISSSLTLKQGIENFFRHNNTTPLWKNRSLFSLARTSLENLVQFLLILTIFLIWFGYIIKFKPIRNITDKIFSFVKEKARVYGSLLWTKIKTWGINFYQAPPKIKIRMLIRPTILILAVFVIYKIYPYFTPPKIITTIPENTASEIPLKSSFEIIFDRPMLKKTVEKSFSIEPKVDGTFEWEADQKLVFTPSEYLLRDQVYTVKLKGVVFSKHLVPLFKKQEFSFSSLGNPKVSIASPTTETLEEKTPITIIFDRPMVPITTEEENQKFESPITIEPEVKGEGRWLGTTAYQLRPDEPYKKATKYKVVVHEGISSIDGGVMKEPYVWEFYGQLPRVVSTEPSYDYAYANPFGVIKFTFNQQINLESFRSKFSFADINKNEIQGSSYFDAENANTIVFKPSAPLKRTFKYAAKIKSGLMGIEGNVGTESIFNLPFWIADTPGILTSSPESGSEYVGDEYGVSVQFKTPMDIKSLEQNITITPAQETKPYIYMDSYNKLYINIRLERSTRYTFTVSQNAKDQYGVPLGNPYSFYFTTAPFKPAVTIQPSYTYFTVFNQKIDPIIIANVINAPELKYDLYKIDLDEFIHLYRLRYDYNHRRNVCGNDYGCGNWAFYKPADKFYLNTWFEKVDYEENNSKSVISRIKGKDGADLDIGLYFLTIELPDKTHDNIAFLVTNSSLTVKQSEKQIFVWAVDQSTGNPIENMNLKYVNGGGVEVASGVSNNEGVWMRDLTIEESLNSNAYTTKGFVIGEKDEEFVISSIDWNDGIEPSNFGIYTSYYGYNQESQDYKIYIVTDNSLYRPGEEVYFKGIIRKDNDAKFETLEPGELVNVSIKDNEGNSLYSENIPINSFGSFWGSFKISEEGKIGYHNISAGYQKSQTSQSFQVEEYRKPEYALTISSLDEKIIRGQPAEALINASYYYGAPLKDTEVKWEIKRRDHYLRWEKNSQYDFTFNDTSQWGWNYYESYFGETLTQGTGYTDKNGDLIINIPTTIPDVQDPQKIVIEASVQDESNQVIAGSREFTLHNSDFYIGLKPSSYVNTENQNAEIDVVTIDTDDKEVGNKDINLKLYKREWDTIREKNQNTGRFYYTSVSRDEQVDETSVTTNEYGYTKAYLKPNSGGTFIVVATSTDRFGNEVKTNTYIWVRGKNQNSQRLNHDRINLITDKTDYMSGEDVTLFADSPYEKQIKSLFTVERDHVIDYFLADTGGDSSKTTVKVQDSFTPNAYLSVLIPKAGDSLQNPPEFKIGYTKINVTNPDNKIVVDINTDKPKYGPRDTMKISTQVKDLNGNPKKSEVLIGVIDKAVWDLSGYSLKDVYDYFYKERPLNVQTSNLLTISMDRINANVNIGSKGGGGAPEADAFFETSRTKFLTTALWKPDLVTDENGYAEFEFELPDNLTTWKLIAVAATQDTGFGSITEETITTKDILVRPFITRFLANGDIAKIGAIIVNQTENDLNLGIEIIAEGINILENYEKNIFVPAEDQTKYIVNTETTGTDTARFGFSVTDSEGNIKDAVEIPIPINNYYTPEVVSASGELSDSAEETIFLPENIVSDMGEVDITLTSDLSVTNFKLSEDLLDFAYGCNEQKTSKLLTALSLYEIMEFAQIENFENMNLKTKDQYKTAISGYVQELNKTQKSDGGWGWWSFNSSDPYLSAYTYHALNRASQSGFLVPENTMQRAQSYLNTLLRISDDKTPSGVGYLKKEVSQNQKAYILYVLGGGNSYSSYASFLYDKRFELSIEARAHLAMAMSNMRGLESQTKRLRNEIISLMRKTATTAFWEEKRVNYYSYGSDTATTATVLEMLVKYDKNNVLIKDIIKHLTTDDNNYRWTTKSTAKVFESISTVIRTKKNMKIGDYYKIEINGQTVDESQITDKKLFEVINYSSGLENLTFGSDNSVRVSRSGKGSIYYNVDLEYYLPYQEVEPLEKGFTVIRELVDEEGNILYEPKITEGEDLWIRLIVVVPELRRNIVIEDRLPAGLESVNENLLNSGILTKDKPQVKTTSDFGMGYGENIRDTSIYYYFDHKEFRDDRTAVFAGSLYPGVYEVMYKTRATTPGTYHHPPAQAYEMYVPDIMGHSDGGWFEVVAK